MCIYLFELIVPIIADQYIEYYNIQIYMRYIWYFPDRDMNIKICIYFNYVADVHWFNNILVPEL